MVYMLLLAILTFITTGCSYLVALKLIDSTNDLELPFSDE